MNLQPRRLADDLAAPSDLSVDTFDGTHALITIRRAGDGNRLTPSTLAHLRQAAADLAQDRRLNAVIVTGEGDAHFSSGIFNIQLRAAYSKEDSLAIVKLANEAFDAIEALPQIVIGALNGAVRAGGGELALACDLRVCARHASIAFHESSYACFPGAGAPVRLPPIVGAGRALEMLTTGRVVEAEEMLRIGLVNQVVEGPLLAATARELAAQIGSKGPLAVRGAKQIARRRSGADAQAAHELSWALRCGLEYSQDVDEAIAAHREQRPARYQGR